MVFTYDVNTDRGKVRLLLGDTDSNDVLLQDDEVDYFLTLSNNVYGAAVAGARAIAGRFARRADTTVEGVSKQYSQQSKSYYALAAQLEAQASRSGVDPAISGISRDEIETQRQKTDRVRSRFRVGQFDNPDTGADDRYDYY